MSYCVNCGVELADSENICPLCGTEVINPAKPAVRVHQYPYPRRVETLSKNIDKKFLVSIAGTLMLIPTAITIFCDFVSGGGISWSLYVAGAMLMLFTWIFLPMLFRKSRPWLSLSLDSIAAALYVGVICAVSGGDWYWTLGLPITASCCGLVVFLAVLFELESTKGILIRAAFVLFGVGLLTVVLELIINLHLGLSLIPRWSGYVFTPCLLLGIAALILRKQKNFKEEIRRRFYV